jgi:hypothetical protein
VYIDPGSGLLAIQVISSTVVGFVFMARKRLQRLVKVVFSRTEESDSTGDAAP